MKNNNQVSSLLAELYALLERASITFNDQPYPISGWAVFTAGGPGSGKSYSIKKQFLIDAKIMDSDQIKRSYVKLLKKMINSDLFNDIEKKQLLEPFDGHIPNFKNPIDMDNVHRYTSWKKHFFSRMYNNFLKSAGKRLSNVIIDTTGNNIDEIVSSVSILKNMGYKTSMVWVVANVDIAKMRNSVRGRTVPNDYLEYVHNKLIKVIPNTIREGLFNELDELWVLFNENNNEIDYKKRFKNTVFKLDKIDGKFTFSEGMLERILDFSGIKQEGKNFEETY